MNLTPTRVRGLFGPRLAWPEIFQYRTRDGELHDCPPAREIPWTTKVYKLEAYEELKARNKLSDPLHTGRPRSGPIDNSRTA